MQPDYPVLIDPATVVPTMIASLIHVLALASQLAVAVFLLASGVHDSIWPDRDTRLLRKLGAVRGARQGVRRAGWLRVVLGMLILLPPLTGAPFVLSLFGCTAAVAFLFVVERRLTDDDVVPGRIARHAVIAAAGFAALFMSWEREDAISLGGEVLRVAALDRAAALEWQQAGDAKAPKVGDLAPDFALQDPSGERLVRLSDFRGKRPVALVFGSYT